ncbi:MAG: type II secretion system F family protein [Thermoguttaceae bacterium]
MGGQVIALILFLGLATAVAAVGMFARDLAVILSGARPNAGAAAQPVRLRRLKRLAVETEPGGMLTRFDRWFSRLVQETGWSWTPMAGALLVGFGCLACGGPMFLWSDNPIAAGVGGLIGAAVAIAVLVIRRIRRIGLLQRQFPGVLEFIARNLRAGHSLDEAIELVAQDGPKPLAAEFQLCSRQLAMGLGVPGAVRLLADRVRLVDMKIFATLLSIHRGAGGNVAEVLERFAYSIRERMSYRRQLRAITSAGRMSAFFVAGLGPILFVYMYVFHTEYIQQMLASPFGQTLLLAAVVLEVIGLVWTLRLMKPVY